MSKKKFWEIIDAARKQSQGDESKYCEALRDELQTLPIKEIADFNDYLHSYLSLAYRTDLWGAAAVISGFCSDDGFEYFLRWVISNGRRIYEGALTNPDSLVDVADENTKYGFEEFGCIAADAYKQKTGQDIPYGESKDVGNYDPEKDPNDVNLDDGNPLTNICQRLPFDDLILQAQFPRLCEKFNGPAELSWEAANIYMAIQKYMQKHNGKSFIHIGFGAFNKDNDMVDDRLYWYGHDDLVKLSLEDMLEQLNKISKTNN